MPSGALGIKAETDNEEPPMKRTPYLIALIGVVLVSVAGAEPCAWVLWAVSESIGRDNELYARTVTPKSAYDNRQECLKDVCMEAAGVGELLKHSRTMSVRSVPQAGGAERVIVEGKSGGGFTTLFTCFPHPVTPE
jgi:hypothetical protein